MSCAWLIQMGDKNFIIQAGTVTSIDVEGKTFTINSRNGLHIETGSVGSDVFPGTQFEIGGVPITVKRMG